MAGGGGRGAGTVRAQELGHSNGHTGAGTVTAGGGGGRHNDGHTGTGTVMTQRAGRGVVGLPA